MKKMFLNVVLILTIFTTFNGYSASSDIDPLAILNDHSVSTAIEPLSISESISIQFPDGYECLPIDETLGTYYRNATRVVFYKKSHAGLLTPEFRSIIMNVLSNSVITDVQEKRLADLYDDTAITFSAYNDCVITDVKSLYVGGLPVRRIKFTCDNYGNKRYGDSIYFLPFDSEDLIFLIGTDPDEDVITSEMEQIMDGWTATMSEIN